MINNNIIQTYQAINNKITELHNLLADKLYKFEIINENEKTLSFTTLLEKVTPTNMESIVINTMPTPVPINSTQRFTTIQQITTYINTHSTLSEMNLLLIQKFLFYYQYLAYRLEEMNVPISDIKKAKSIKALILLLNKVKRQKHTYIYCNADENNKVQLYANYNNTLGIHIYDEDGEDVTEGRIRFCQKNNNNSCQYYNLSDTIILNLPVGEYCYIIEYDNQNSRKYKSSSLEIDVVVSNAPLVGQITLTNLISNITFSPTDTIAEGYKGDTWNINIDIHKADNTHFNSPIPFKLYIGSDNLNWYLLTENITNNNGTIDLNNLLVNYATSDFIAGLSEEYSENDDVNWDENTINNDNVIYLFVKTNFGSDDKIIISRAIDLNHHPVQILNNSYEYYKTDKPIPSLQLQLIDKKSGNPRTKINPYEDYYVQVENLGYQSIGTNIISYNINNIITSLPNEEYNEKEYNIHVILSHKYGATQEYKILFEVNYKIKIISNFEIPTETSFFLNDTPQIYYKPLGQIGQNKQADINGTTYYTNANGLLHAIGNNKTPGQYTLTLTAKSKCTNNSDSLTEIRHYSYELKKPFDIELISLNKSKEAKYKIIIYDIEHYDKNNIKVYDSNNQLCSYTYRLEGNIAYITIKRKTVGPGIKKLDVTINGYHEQTTFEFYEQIFTLQTQEVRLGSNKQIIFKAQDSDIDITYITLTGNGLSNNFVATKKNDLITFTGTILQAYPNGTSITIAIKENPNDEESYISETFTIIIPKENLTNYLTTSDYQDVYIRPATLPIVMKSNVRPTTESINLIFNDGYTGHTDQIITQTYNNTSTNLTTSTLTTLGTYTASITFNGNTNYNNLYKTFTYRISSDEVYVKDVILNANGDLVIETIEVEDVDNTDLVSDLYMINCELFVVYEKIRDSEDNYSNIIKDVFLTNNELTYKRENETVWYAHNITIDNNGNAIIAYHKDVGHMTEEKLITNLSIDSNGILHVTYEDGTHTYATNNSQIVKNVHEGTAQNIIYQR